MLCPECGEVVVPGLMDVRRHQADDQLPVCRWDIQSRWHRALVKRIPCRDQR